MSHSGFSKGAAAKTTKNVFNRQRIYPPRTTSRADIPAAAAPAIQAPIFFALGASVSICTASSD